VGDNPVVSLRRLAHKVYAKLGRLVVEMKRPEEEKAHKIVADLVRNYFRLLTVAVRETKRHLDDAQLASSTLIVADQQATNRRSCHSTATREKKRTSLSRSSELESESVRRKKGLSPPYSQQNHHCPILEKRRRLRLSIIRTT
jgi:hypothetical protein